jgi:hypothetical protein
MSSELILMPYKENCKIEGEVITKIKIIRMRLVKEISCKTIAIKWQCNKNTVTNILKLLANAPPEAMGYLKSNKSIPSDKLFLFDFLKNCSRKPHSHSRCLNQRQETVIVEKQQGTNWGVKRMFRNLKRQGFDMKVFTLAKIKGVYKRKKLRVKKKRTVNGERRALYDYDKIEAFEYLQYDTKVITDMHALPKEIYWKFKSNSKLPVYQWTIVDAKTKVRFLAWSHSLNSFFGLKFLEFVLVWLRAHQVMRRIKIQMDGGGEFCSASKRKLAWWNEKLKRYNAVAYDTEGVKWKQNLVERTHRIDDEEFYCPRGELIHSKEDFLAEGQLWIMYYNNRVSEGIGLEGVSPRDKLEQLGYFNAKAICSFPCLILEDYFRLFYEVFDFEKSQNVLTYYQIEVSFQSKTTLSKNTP